MKSAHLALACCAASALLLARPAFSWTTPDGDHDGDAVKLDRDQTLGFGDNKLLIFKYDQNFDCVDQREDDRNYNGVQAEADPAELEQDICQIGAPSTMDPTGASVKQTDKLYVLVPMFSLNDDRNPNDAFTPALGATLIKLFGDVPEAFKTHPLVSVQCPDPGLPPGSCTMHGDRVDLFPALAALGKVPATPKHNIFVPLPNHDHLVSNANIRTNEEWWQVITVLVDEPSYWPNADGTSGITSVAKLKRAESDGVAIQAPSNFFLFFNSHPMASMK
jgi:hypothetical protein